MKIALTIAALERGGAEQQLLRLAHGLIQRGHTAEVWCYGGASALDESLRESGIEVVNAPPGSRFGKLLALRHWMRQRKPDVVHAFMKRASGASVLARGFRGRPVVIGSDLSTATYGKRDLTLWLSLMLFRGCNVVATQTELNRGNLERLAPWLRGRTRVIRNGLDVSRFQPCEASHHQSPFRFVCVGTVYRVKNPVRLVQAIEKLVKRGVRGFVVDWYGRLGLGGDAVPSEEYHECVRHIEAAGLGDYIRFHGERSDIVHAYHQAHALIHPSVQEGFPNAVVEGMACGLPVLVSGVSDLPLVVETARNGFLFDETQPESIADAMQRMLILPRSERLAMQERSRALAEQWFALERFVTEYESLYRELLEPMRA